MIKIQKKAKERASRADSDKIAAGIAARILKVQTCWAKRMQRYSEKLSRKGKIIWLVGCCLFTSIYSLITIVNGLNGKSKNHIEVGTVQQPITITPDARSFVDTITRNRIKIFRCYMDSLSKDSSGKKTYDSIRRIRPGLMDSIHSIEKMIQSQ